MDNKKIGEFILQLRKEKGVSQEEVANSIFITRQAISKWEQGKSIPDAEKLKLLSDYFNVTINEMLAGKHLKNEHVNDIQLEMYKSKNKLKKKLNLSIIMILIIIIAFLGFYFLTTYNSIKIYKVGSDSKNVFITNGLFIITKNKIYFNLGTIHNKTDKKILDIELYYHDEYNDYEKIYYCRNCSDYEVVLYDFYGYDAYFDTKNLIKTIEKRKMYVDIILEDNSKETLKLDITKDFANNSILSKKEKVSSIENKPVNNLSNQDYIYVNKSDLSYIKNNWKRVDDGYISTFKEDKTDIIVGQLDDNIYIEKYNNTINEYWTYNIKYHEMNYELYENKKSKKFLSFNITKDENEENKVLKEEFERIINISLKKN